MKRKKHILIVILLLVSMVTQAQVSDPLTYTRQIEALDVEIAQLNQQIPRLRDNRDPSYFYVKRELDIAIFKKNYTQFVYEENLNSAKNLTENKLQKSFQKKDDYSIGLYEQYLLEINGLIKTQMQRYQALFDKERFFRRHYNKTIKPGTIESYEQALRFTQLALKYARERNLVNALDYVNKYHNYAEALLFDANSEYDLAKITHSNNNFLYVFQPLVSSDSLQHIEEAGNLVEQCFNYAANSKSILDTNYFALKQRAVISAMADYHANKGNELNNITDRVIYANLHEMNPNGVYKWGRYILVIDTISLNANLRNVMQGEAIIEADRKLIEYISTNNLGKVKKTVKFGETFVLPYVISGAKKTFYYDSYKQIWQYMVCYTRVESAYFTKQVSQYMSPITFTDKAEEKPVAQNME